MNMNMSRKSKAGFTLVELMVVAIIVAILAAVAIPLMTAQRKRAMATEAEAGLGALRTAMRVMFAETAAYNKKPDGTTLAAGAIGTMPGVIASDLDGKYFINTDYALNSVTASNYVMRVTGSKTDVLGITIDLNQDGVFTRTGL